MWKKNIIMCFFSFSFTEQCSRSMQWSLSWVRQPSSQYQLKSVWWSTLCLTVKLRWAPLLISSQNCVYWQHWPSKPQLLIHVVSGSKCNRAKSILELSSYLSGISSNGFMLPSRVLIGCSLLSQECCKLIGWYWIIMRKQLYTWTCPIGFSLARYEAESHFLWTFPYSYMF